MGDEGGVGGPKGDGRGKEWTVDLCSKRLSLLHRKLRQVMNGRERERETDRWQEEAGWGEIEADSGVLKGKLWLVLCRVFCFE